VEISHILEEYLVQHLWIERNDITMEPDELDELAKRNFYEDETLCIKGLGQDGLLRILKVDCFEVNVEHYDSFFQYERCQGWCEDYIPLLNIRYLPSKLLKAPLLRSEYPLYSTCERLFDRRIHHEDPTLDFRCLLWGIHHVWDCDYNYIGPVVVDPQAIDAAIHEAISTSNHYCLEATIPLPLNTDCQDTLQPVTPEHFINAAQRRDITAVRLLWSKGYKVFPFENNEVHALMQDPETESHGSNCQNIAFIDHLKHIKWELDNQRTPDVYVRRWGFIDCPKCGR
jgi:hypothetical protein